MSVEADLLLLARGHEQAAEAALNEMLLDAPNLLRRQLRAYLARQVDGNRIRKTDESMPALAVVPGGRSELTCENLKFSSGARVDFSIELEDQQRGWRVRRFKFHVRLPPPRSIRMVRIHLNPAMMHDPLKAPRCHMHIDESQAHIAFPIMNPRLVLHLICEHIEPDLGL